MLFSSPGESTYYSVNITSCLRDGSLDKCAGGDGGGLSLKPSDEWCAERHDGVARCSSENPVGGGCFSTGLAGDEESFMRDVYANLKECRTGGINVTLTLCSE